MTAPDAPPRPAPRPRRGGDLGPRLVTTAVGIPTIIGLIWLGGPVYTLVVAALMGIGAYEIARAAGHRSGDLDALTGALIAAAVPVAAHLELGPRINVIAGLLGLSLFARGLRGEGTGGLQRWAGVMAGAAYVGVLGAHLVSLRLLDDGRQWVLLMLFTTFATDTGAYAVGRAVGRRKLAPRISPGKTVEGAIGGLIAASVVCVALNEALGLDRGPLAMLALGAAAGVAAQAGDLFESLLKRRLGVKDMGRLFPGHGGALDRLDSILFVAPLVYYVVRWWLT